MIGLGKIKSYLTFVWDSSFALFSRKKTVALCQQNETSTPSDVQIATANTSANATGATDAIMNTENAVSFTEPQHLNLGLGEDELSFCNNCRTPLHGGFCSGCGQKNTSLARPIWYLLSDLTEDIISRDSKLFRTIGQIIFHPGSLTRDFMDGKRARFIPPVRFYLLCTLLFFVTLAVTDVAILKVEFVERGDTANISTTDAGFSVYTGGRMGASREEVLAGLQAVRSQVFDKLKVSDQSMGTSFLNKWNQGVVSTPMGGGVSPTQETSAKQANTQPIIGQEDTEPQLSETENEIVAEHINAPTEEFRDDPTVVVSGGDGGLVPFGNISAAGIRAGMFMPAAPADNIYILPDDVFDEEKKSMQETLDEEGNPAIITFILSKTIKAMDGIIHLSQDPQRLYSTLNDWISRVMIFLLPFFAFLLRFFYWKRENCLMKQFIFSLHFHSAVFLIMTFLVISQTVWGAVVSASMFYAIVPLYLFIAMKVASRQGIIRTTLKFMAVSFFYIITLSFTVLFTLMLSLSEI